jgi:hypothetical protein
MHASGQHPTRRAAAFAVQGLDHHLADAQRAVDRLDDAVSGQVEKHARSITLRARRLDHGSWSFFDESVSTTPISAHEPLYDRVITSNCE